MGNAYLDKQKIREQEIFQAGMDIGYQRCLDYMQWVLRNPEYVGKDTFSKKRWLEIFEGLKECDRLFGDAFTQSRDADYYQEKLDANIREIFGDDTMPFYERYPTIKKIRYNKPKKGWV